jgi:hypothetical protein
MGLVSAGGVVSVLMELGVGPAGLLGVGSGAPAHATNSNNIGIGHFMRNSKR